MSAQKEFGDFQTPLRLASEVVALVDRLSGKPDRVVEPTAGLGSFLEAAQLQWGAGPKYEGFELNPAYVRETSLRLMKPRATVRQQDFFSADWPSILRASGAKRLLVIGNPPWVTNSALGSLGSQNLPSKANFQGLRGFDAKTGKANFDIAEWMLIRLIESLTPEASIAMLCKTMTARKVLRHFWKTEGGLADAALFLIDAKAHFGAAVDACLFYSHGRRTKKKTARVYADLSTKRRLSEFGLVDGCLVSDVEVYEAYHDIDGGSPYQWRSGIKHDASKIMEFVPSNGHYTNGLDEKVELESEFIYPLLKSSDLGNGRIQPRRFVLITQKRIGDPTAPIREIAPQTWKYLEKHSKQLNARKSTIYDNRPKFSIFGIGDYSFSRWKVAISGLYKSLRFTAVPPYRGRPVMLDDTCYFVTSGSEREANLICDLLNSEPCLKFLSSLSFQDSKRPVTTEILRRISLAGIAKRLSRLPELNEFIVRFETDGERNDRQLDLVMENSKAYRPSHVVSRKAHRAVSLRRAK
jgi:hypothetical protein